MSITLKGDMLHSRIIRRIGQAGGTCCTQWLTNVICKVWESGSAPEDCKAGIIYYPSIKVKEPELIVGIKRATGPRKTFDNIFSCLDKKTHKSDGQTDGRTPAYSKDCA